jgi:hypothetical protein
MAITGFLASRFLGRKKIRLHHVPAQPRGRHSVIREGRNEFARTTGKILLMGLLLGRPDRYALLVTADIDAPAHDFLLFAPVIADDVPDGLQAPLALGLVCPDIDHRAGHLRLFGREPTTYVKSTSGPLAPLTQTSITNVSKSRFGSGSEQVDGCVRAGVSCGACVPDRPAKTRLDSLIAAVDREHG